MGDPDAQRSGLVALEVAIQTEKDGRDFYARAAERTSDPGGKVLFASLADDELEHLRLLQSQRKALTEDGRWLPSAASEEQRVREIGGAPIFGRETLARNVDTYTSELSALRMAYLIERDAVTFYTRAASETEDPDGRVTYERLVVMEKEHQGILEEEYNALAREFWSTMGFEPF
jgi:rubrerythrin